MEEKTEIKEEKVLLPTDIESLKAYNQLQYDRIDKLENQRFSFANLILTLSTGALTLGYPNTTTPTSNLVQEIVIPLMIFLGNFMAIMYIHKSRGFIKMHQERAEKARDLYSPILNQLNKEVKKVNSNKDIFRRSNLHIYLHVLFMCISLGLLIHSFLISK